jgi:hypothetical protein
VPPWRSSCGFPGSQCVPHSGRIESAGVRSRHPSRHRTRRSSNTRDLGSCEGGRWSGCQARTWWLRMLVLRDIGAAFTNSGLLAAARQVAAQRAGRRSRAGAPLRRRAVSTRIGTTATMAFMPSRNGQGTGNTCRPQRTGHPWRQTLMAAGRVRASQPSQRQRRPHVDFIKLPGTRFVTNRLRISRR